MYELNLKDKYFISNVFDVSRAEQSGETVRFVYNDGKEELVYFKNEQESLEAYKEFLDFRKQQNARSSSIVSEYKNFIDY